MKKITCSLLLLLSLSINVTAYAYAGQSHQKVSPFHKGSRSLKALKGPADTPEIVSASISDDVLDIYVLVPQYREPDSLQIRSVSGTWTGANLVAGSLQLFFPYVDAYDRQCWHFLIPMSGYATPGDSYVLRFTDWTHTAANEVTVVY